MTQLTNLFWKLLAKLFGIGEGTHRWVFKIPFTGKILKVDKCDGELQNHNEYLMWSQHSEAHFHRQFLTPVLWASPTKRYLIQPYVQSLNWDDTFDGFSDRSREEVFNEQIESFAIRFKKLFPFVSDLHDPDSYGTYNGRTVLRDYGSLVSGESSVRGLFVEMQALCNTFDKGFFLTLFNAEDGTVNYRIISLDQQQKIFKQGDDPDQLVDFLDQVINSGKRRQLYL